MSELSILGFVAKLGVLHHEVSHLNHRTLESACKIIEREAKAAIGTYRYGWTPLAESTKRERARLGYSADDPLLRSGELRASIQHTVHGNVGYVGSNDPKAEWNFVGTSRIPARDPIRGALNHSVDEVEHTIGQGIARWFGHRGSWSPIR